MQPRAVRQRFAVELAAAMVLAGGLSIAGATQAQPASAPAAASAPADPAAAERGEPHVQRSVVEDDGSRIEELRVRGRVQRVTVQPKVGNLAPYEILVPRNGRDALDGTGGADGAAGKRVWNLFRF